MKLLIDIINRHILIKHSPSRPLINLILRFTSFIQLIYSLFAQDIHFVLLMFHFVYVNLQSSSNMETFGPIQNILQSLILSFSCLFISQATFNSPKFHALVYFDFSVNSKIFCCFVFNFTNTFLCNIYFALNLSHCKFHPRLSCFPSKI